MRLCLCWKRTFWAHAVIRMMWCDACDTQIVHNKMATQLELLLKLSKCSNIPSLCQLHIWCLELSTMFPQRLLKRYTVYCWQVQEETPENIPTVVISYSILDSHSIDHAISLALRVITSYMQTHYCNYCNFLNNTPCSRTSFSSALFSVTVSQAWNKLPSNIRQITTYCIFKRHL